MSHEPRGDHGFGFDPIFEPYDRDGRTFGEMELVEKIAISHRSRAISNFGNWYVKRLADSLG
jgi:XTP/dITP diphosphohydrolase